MNKKMRVVLSSLALFAATSMTSFGASAQEIPDMVCPEGQTFEIWYVCDRETLKCKVEWWGCV